MPTIKKLFKNRKIYFNITATFKAYALSIKTEGVRLYIISLIIHLKDLLVRFLIFKEYIGKVIYTGLVLVIYQWRLRFYIQQ